MLTILRELLLRNSIYEAQILPRIRGKVRERDRIDGEPSVGKEQDVCHVPRSDAWLLCPQGCPLRLCLEWYEVTNLKKGRKYIEN